MCLDSRQKHECLAGCLACAAATAINGFQLAVGALLMVKYMYPLHDMWQAADLCSCNGSLGLAPVHCESKNDGEAFMQPLHARCDYVSSLTMRECALLCMKCVRGSLLADD